MPQFQSTARLRIILSSIGSLKLSKFHLILFLLALFYLSSAQVAFAQDPPPCPTSSSSTSFTFEPTAVGQSHTETINLAPCETIDVRESHDMGGDGNRGTNLRVSYSNGAGQELYSQTIWGFFTATDNRFPASYAEPFPWVGVRFSGSRPATLKVESTFLLGMGNPPIPPRYNFTITRVPRPGYNVGGDSFDNALLVPSFPATYRGSLRAGGDPAPIDPGQFFKVRLECGQAIYVHGSATENTHYGGNYTVEVYNSSQQLVTTLVYIAAYGTATYSSGPFINPNSTTSDFYIRVRCQLWAIEDFTLNIAEYVPPRPVAPDATGTGSAVVSADYHPGADANDFNPNATTDTAVLPDRPTEHWAKYYWPQGLSGGPYPLLIFLHGNHASCGRNWKPFVESGNPGTLRNNLDGWVGMKITVGSQPITVRYLGRIYINGNTGTHTVKIVRASDGTDVPGGAVNISMPGTTHNTIKYNLLASPVTLSANTSYYIVSQETNGGDYWYDSDTIVTTTSVATVNGRVSGPPNGSNWDTSGGVPGQAYGPVDFRYDVAARIDDDTTYTMSGTYGTCPDEYTVAPSHRGYDYLANQLASWGYIVVSINSNLGMSLRSDGYWQGNNPSHPEYPDDPGLNLARGRLVLRHLQRLSEWHNGITEFVTNTTLGTPRNNFNGWVGMKITVGSQPITVRRLGRMYRNLNTGTHTVKIVRASDNVVMGSVSIPMTGGNEGQFKYVQLTSPVTLAANISYYVVSQEVNGGDYWYDSDTTITSRTVATVDGRVSSTDGSNWNTAGGVAGQVYGPVDFIYDAASTPTALGVDFRGKIDLNNIGLMGHSRGGEGVRAAYNLFRDPGSPWPARIPGMTTSSTKAIFEIAPVDGQTSRILNADGVKWNVLLPACDGDVITLKGVRPFDRMTFIRSESPATQKSTFMVWGANHNFYNTQWQESEPQATCTGIGNTPLFLNPAPDGAGGYGSLDQRKTALGSVVPFFRANVGASANPSFNQNFDPRYDLPPLIPGIPTRVERGFTPSPNSSVTTVFEDFDQETGRNSNYTTINPATNNDSNITIAHGTARTESDCVGPPPLPHCLVIPDHFYDDTDFMPMPPAQQLFKAGAISWTLSGPDTYFQTNWNPAGGSTDVRSYQTLEFRVSRQRSETDPLQPHSLNTAETTDFRIQLVKDDGSTLGSLSGKALRLSWYADLRGPVGGIIGLHPITQSVRIPLADFACADLSQIRGIRFIFDRTSTGAIYLANIRLAR